MSYQSINQSTEAEANEERYNVSDWTDEKISAQYLAIVHKNETVCLSLSLISNPFFAMDPLAHSPTAK